MDSSNELNRSSNVDGALSAMATESNSSRAKRGAEVAAEDAPAGGEGGSRRVDDHCVVVDNGVSKRRKVEAAVEEGADRHTVPRMCSPARVFSASFAYVPVGESKFEPVSVTFNDPTRQLLLPESSLKLIKDAAGALPAYEGAPGGASMEGASDYDIETLMGKRLVQICHKLPTGLMLVTVGNYFNVACGRLNCAEEEFELSGGRGGARFVTAKYEDDSAPAASEDGNIVENIEGAPPPPPPPPPPPASSSSSSSSPKSEGGEGSGDSEEGTVISVAFMREKGDLITPSLPLCSISLVRGGGGGGGTVIDREVMMCCVEGKIIDIHDGNGLGEYLCIVEPRKVGGKGNKGNRGSKGKNYKKKKGYYMK